MKILRLTAENIKRLSAVEIASDGSPMVVIAGENEAGKSSVLDAIEYALAGASSLPAKPLRKGHTKGVSIVDLGDYVVTRTFTPTGGSLTVTNRDGAKFPSPQALLDGLIGKLTFDPLAFADSNEKTQAETLRRLAGIDTLELDLERQGVFDERTLLNRDVTQLQGALAKAPQHTDVGLMFADAALLTRRLEQADAAATHGARLSTDASMATVACEVAKRKATEATVAVEQAREALARAEEASLMADEAVLQAEVKAREARTVAEQAGAQVPDRTALRQELAGLESINRKVQDNQAHAALVKDLADKKRTAAALTDRLAAIDSKKAEQLSAAQFPVEGLGLDETGVTWNGLPFAQASSAVRIRASVAIAIAINPRLRVCLVRNGNDLDTKNLQLLAACAKDADLQLWVERINGGGDGHQTVVIEDGAVAQAVNV